MLAACIVHIVVFRLSESKAISALCVAAVVVAKKLLLGIDFRFIYLRLGQSVGRVVTPAQCSDNACSICGCVRDEEFIGCVREQCMW